MNALRQHLANNANAIETQAQEYAQNYNVSIEVARRDVSDEYIQGFVDEMEARRYGD